MCVVHSNLTVQHRSPPSCAGFAFISFSTRLEAPERLGVLGILQVESALKSEFFMPAFGSLATCHFNDSHEDVALRDLGLRLAMLGLP